MSSFKDAVKSGMNEYLVDLKTKLEGLTEAEIYWNATLGSNSIAWLVWHMARVEDGWINSTIAGGESVWDSGNWAERTGVTYENGDFGETDDEAPSLPVVDVGVVIDYYDAVRAAAFEVIDDMTDEDLSQSFTRGNRSVTWSWILGHVLVEEAQHLGQVGFIRGMIRGLNG